MTRITRDTWLSAVLERSVFRVEFDAGLGVDDDSREAADICAGVAAHGSGFYYAKVPTSRVDRVRDLARAGFCVVDVNVQLSADAGAVSTRPSSAVAVGEIEPHEADEVMEIAGSSFKYSRFHLDPLFPRAIADRVKREWIHNYARKLRGERLFVARIGDRPAGFLAALHADTAGARVRVIDLIGVGPRYQRQGVGRSLVAGFVDCYRNRCDRFQAGTQAANVPSLGFYQAHGFSITSTTYVLHLHA